MFTARSVAGATAEAGFSCWARPPAAPAIHSPVITADTITRRDGTMGRTSEGDRRTLIINQGHAGVRGGDLDEAIPVGAHRRKDVDRDGAVGTGGRLVQDVRRNLVGIARPQLARLAINGERQHALQHDAELFVRMLMRSDDGEGVELDDGEREGLAVDHPRKRAGPDWPRTNLSERSERAHTTGAAAFGSPASHEAICSRDQR